MLTGIEFEQCENILRLLPDPDVVSLKDTVTKNLIVTTTVEEARDVILQFSNSGKELLQRKKMKRNFLFLYLHKVGIPVDPSKEKDGLIQSILSYWDILKGVTIPNLSTNPQESGTSSGSSLSQVESEKLGAEFLDLFYGLLKELARDSEATSWGKSYFAENCKLVVTVMNKDSTDISVENYIGAEMCEQTLADLARIQKLCFFKQEFKSSVHDSVVVVNVKGDVKKLVFPELSQAIAKFEQTFHLQQTFTDSWIIELCDLNIKMNET
uniref:Uncharacterized protein C3orf38 homolog n=1 Tax=Phallusia mammillata TaxID=59560 RepID=A0A6F9D7H6_9ASCI|nr:uncharacterized protein C3orf38 homolog [Phallusia mammillata]